MKRGTAILALSAIVFTMTGCATKSIVLGTTEVVSVQTTYAGRLVSGASCRLENSQGTWFATSPDTITIHRAYDDLNIRCEKAGLPTAVMTFPAEGAYGGFESSAGDISNGGSFKYPSLLTIPMEGVVPQPPAYRGEE